MNRHLLLTICLLTAGQGINAQDKESKQIAKATFDNTQFIIDTIYITTIESDSIYLEIQTVAMINMNDFLKATTLNTGKKTIISSFTVKDLVCSNKHFSKGNAFTEDMKKCIKRWSTDEIDQSLWPKYHLFFSEIKDNKGNMLPDMRMVINK